MDLTNKRAKVERSESGGCDQSMTQQTSIRWLPCLIFSIESIRFFSQSILPGKIKRVPPLVGFTGSIAYDDFGGSPQTRPSFRPHRCTHVPKILFRKIQCDRSHGSSPQRVILEHTYAPSPPLPFRFLMKSSKDAPPLRPEKNQDNRLPIRRFAHLFDGSDSSC